MTTKSKKLNIGNIDSEQGMLSELEITKTRKESKEAKRMIRMNNEKEARLFKQGKRFKAVEGIRLYKLQ